MPETNPPLWRIGLANTPEQVGRCSSVMRELRPHIKAIDFAARVLQQQKEGYQLAFLELDGVVRSVRVSHLQSPFLGRTLYTMISYARIGSFSRICAALFDGSSSMQEQGCEHLTLDSGVQRFAPTALSHHGWIHVASFLVN